MIFFILIIDNSRIILNKVQINLKLDNPDQSKKRKVTSKIILFVYNYLKFKYLIYSKF